MKQNGKAALIGFGACCLLLTACSSSEPKVVDKADPCGANRYMSLVGTSAKNIKLSELPSNTRVLYPTTPMTRDYRIDRLNIHVSKDGTIMRLDCN